MRSLFVLLVATCMLTACSSQATTQAASTTTAPIPVAQMPKCYNGDAGKFVDVGSSASISGVNVTCEKTADGKGAQWMGKKH
jgi:uncharacterized lipoprotein YajG